MSRFQVTSPKRIPTVSKNKPVTFCIFDVLYDKGKKVSHLHLPLTEQLPEDLPHTKVLSIKGNGKALFDLIKQKQHLEVYQYAKLVTLKKLGIVFYFQKMSCSSAK